MINTLPSPLQTIITSGVGEFLGQRIAATLFPNAQFPNASNASDSDNSEEQQSPVVSLRRELDAQTSVAATAHALAVLARETSV